MTFTDTNRKGFLDITCCVVHSDILYLGWERCSVNLRRHPPGRDRRAVNLTGAVVAAIKCLPGVLGTGVAYVINYALITTLLPKGPTAAGSAGALLALVGVAVLLKHVGHACKRAAPIF